MISNLSKRALSKKSISARFGVVFDVDGVLLRGKKPIPGARKALEELHQLKIPFAIMTNGGGYPEEKKAKQISDIIGFEIPSSILCMSHTPMRSLVKKHGNDLVLTVGKDCDELSAVMKSYGFKNAITVGQLHGHFPTMYPDIKISSPLPHGGRFDEEPFGAVFVLIDPIYWGRELQIVMDVLCSKHGKVGTCSNKQQVSKFPCHSLKLSILINMNRYHYILHALTFSMSANFTYLGMVQEHFEL
jgi:HAD superfamily hydrolase (TIGR01456 family)